jgi:uncharacterized membrane protein (UPF0127 family)
VYFIKSKYCLPTLGALQCVLFISILQLTIFVATTYAQSQKLESEMLNITTSRGNYQFKVEIADEPLERNVGLMNRKKLGPREGMLFVFEQPRIINMWMKNTLISLDMVFISDNGTVVKIAERTVPHSLDLITSGEPAAYVLELAGGMATFIGLTPGNQLKHRFFE